MCFWLVFMLQVKSIKPTKRKKCVKQKGDKKVFQISGFAFDPSNNLCVCKSDWTAFPPNSCKNENAWFSEICTKKGKFVKLTVFLAPFCIIWHIYFGVRSTKAAAALLAWIVVSALPLQKLFSSSSCASFPFGCCYY